MQIKMIVCDLDGTLLRTDKTVSDYTLEILEKCREKGVKFAIATARPIHTTRPFADILKPDTIIYHGGAVALIGDETVYSVPFSANSARAIIEGLQRRDDVERITSEGEDFYITGFAGRFPDNLHKISARLNGPLGDFGKDLADVDIMRYRDENLVRFAHKDATKWRATEVCAERFSIETAEIVAFGDDYIDVEMLENCGVGVAVANAIPEAKAVADFVCDSNDNDGVARWLEANLK